MMLQALLVLMLGSLLAMVVYMGIMLKRRLSRIERLVALLSDHVWDSQSLGHLFPNFTVPPHPGGWAASTDVLAELARMIRAQQPKLVVELGSGLSTLVMASALMRNGGGRLISIEHNEQWAAMTRIALQSSGLERWVDVRIAPLQRQRLADAVVNWYAPEAFAGLEDIEVLFVDGPPADGDEQSRRPALPTLWPHIASEGHVILDDTGRTAERTMVEEWLTSHPTTRVRWLPFDKGCAVLQKTA